MLPRVQQLEKTTQSPPFTPVPKSQRPVRSWELTRIIKEDFLEEVQQESALRGATGFFIPEQKQRASRTFCARGLRRIWRKNALGTGRQRTKLCALGLLGGGPSKAAKCQ